MNIREKLLVELAKNPAYEGKDETEKALVAELKLELEKAKGTAAKAEVDEEVKAAAKEMASQIVAFVKEAMPTIVPEKTDRSAVVDPAKAAVTDEEFEKEVSAAAAAAKVDVSNEKALAQFKKAYHFGEFMRAAVKGNDVRAKALSEGTPEDGGYLVPDAFRAELIQQLLVTDTIRKYATVIPMTGKLLNIPRLSADVAVYWGTENQSISTTSADFGDMTLTPFRLNAIIYTSRELFDDSALSIADILRQRFVDRIADEENKVFLGGNGTSQPKGINTETLRSISAGNSINPTHITQAYWKLPKVYRNTSRWIINSRVMESLENSRDTNGQFLYPSLQGEVQTLKGRPILVDDHQPSSTCVLGDLSLYYIGDRQQVTIEVTTQAGNTWVKHQVGIKVVERVDGEVALTNAFVQISNTGVH